ncbi:MAG: branched-chain amino acid ABC transporter permease [Candidatus Hodarchaeales archaeon]
MDRQDFYEKIEDIWDEIRQRGYYILFFVLLLFFPGIMKAIGFSEIPIISDIYSLGRDNGLFGPNTWVLKIISLCAIWAIFAASWDFLSGFTGQISFGHSIFWGLSAYFAFWIAMPIGVPLNELEIPIFDESVELFLNLFNAFLSWIQDLTGSTPFSLNIPVLRAILLGAIFTALFATIIGIIALRVKGPYLALITLILPLIATRLANMTIFTDITGGNFGYSFIVDPFIIEKQFPPNRELEALNFYIFIIFVFLVLFGIMYLITSSRIGLVFQSIREDEDAAESLGINVRFYKILAFVGSAFFAGLAGGLYAQHPIVRATGPSFFSANFSFSIIIFCVIGGLGTISGGAAGAFLLTILLNLFLNDVFQDVGGLEIFIFGLLLILSLRYMPYGLVRATKDQKRALLVGVSFALSWILLPSSEGWGVDMLSGFLPQIQEIPPSGDFLKNLVDLFTRTVLDFIGKFDMLGQMISSLSVDNFFYFLGLVLMLIFSIPAIIVFLVSEVLGLTIFQEILGLSLSRDALIKAKFLIYVSVGIPFAYYLPKLFKKVRLRYWGVWPSAGRYEPD